MPRCAAGGREENRINSTRTFLQLLIDLTPCPQTVKSIVVIADRLGHVSTFRRQPGEVEIDLSILRSRLAQAQEGLSSFLGMACRDRALARAST